MIEAEQVAIIFFMGGLVGSLLGFTYILVIGASMLVVFAIKRIFGRKKH